MAIIAPRPDGGTAFRASGDAGRWQAWRRDPDLAPDTARPFARLLAEAAREQPEEEQRADARAGGRLASIVLDGVETIGILAVTGMRRERLRLSIRDVGELAIDVERGTARWEARAKYLWSGDWRSTLPELLDGLAASIGLGGTVRERSSPWECTRLELACDFVDLDIAADDWRRVHSRSRVSRIDTLDRLADGGEYDAGEETDPIETLAIGSRASACSIVAYDKTLQIKRRRNDNAPNYVAAWQAGGRWRGAIGPDGAVVGPPVRRVEVRLKDRALELIDKDDDRGTHATEVNLRRIDRLIDPAALAAAWRWATGQVHRMIELESDRTGADYTRRCRAPMDSRWIVVHDAARYLAPIDPGRALKQSRRQAADIHAERVRRSMRKVVTGLAELAAAHGITIDGPAGVAAIVQYATEMIGSEEGGSLDAQAWHLRYFAEHDRSMEPHREVCREVIRRWIATRAIDVGRADLACAHVAPDGRGWMIVRDGPLIADASDGHATIEPSTRELPPRQLDRPPRRVRWAT